MRFSATLISIVALCFTALVSAAPIPAPEHVQVETGVVVAREANPDPRRSAGWLKPTVIHTNAVLGVHLPTIDRPIGVTPPHLITYHPTDPRVRKPFAISSRGLFELNGSNSLTIPA
ncbi:hypothetical protein DFP72DRAFT_1068529 [Ephemerocybe angulata]|uniref:Uncharacterized protein n=1 Tax=Ephemerocybe angulata TaxID=980116 RepID=A0A8H6HZ80_9AGAR|nr:hypothetical protein DFP72DRAFT_1068529 [Tulosesus angulatus]